MVFYELSSFFEIVTSTHYEFLEVMVIFCAETSTQSSFDGRLSACDMTRLPFHHHHFLFLQLPLPIWLPDLAQDYSNGLKTRSYDVLDAIWPFIDHSDPKNAIIDFFTNKGA
jgi:hypothetical protein